jgi:hypothetical protein
MSLAISYSVFRQINSAKNKTRNAVDALTPLLLETEAKACIKDVFKTQNEGDRSRCSSQARSTEGTAPSSPNYVEPCPTDLEASCCPFNLECTYDLAISRDDDQEHHSNPVMDAQYYENEPGWEQAGCVTNQSRFAQQRTDPSASSQIPPPLTFATCLELRRPVARLPPAYIHPSAAVGAKATACADLSDQELIALLAGCAGSCGVLSGGRPCSVDAADADAADAAADAFAAATGAACVRFDLAVEDLLSFATTPTAMGGGGGGGDGEGFPCAALAFLDEHEADGSGDGGGAFADDDE